MVVKHISCGCHLYTTAQNCIQNCPSALPMEYCFKLIKEILILTMDRMCDGTFFER